MLGTLARRRGRAISEYIVARVTHRGFTPRAMSTSSNASGRTLCVITHEKLIESTPIKDRLRRELPVNAYSDVLVGSEAKDFERAGSVGDGPLTMLWWFAPAESTRAFLEADASRTKRIDWMHSGSAGVEHLLAIDAVKSHPSTLTNAKGAFSASLGEWGVFACMYFAKRVDAMRRAQAKSEWVRMTVGMVQGKRMTIVGYGDIGSHVARRAKALGMKVRAVRRFPEKTSPSDESCDEVLAFNRLNDAVKDADYVVVALPSTAETDKMINADVLGSMKKSAVVVNLGRGSTVDEDALVEALRNETIAGAALDVFAVEPLPKDHPFYSMENVLMSFHCADLTEDYHDLALDCFIQHAHEYVEKKPFTNVVNKDLGY
jgi:phosphoglycerate dehydrogenase-like enzyme